MGLNESNPPKVQYPYLYLTNPDYDIQHVVDENEFKLTSNQESRAVLIIKHNAIYLMAVQMDKVLQDNINDRFNHANPNIKNASHIIRLIRNAYAHNPLLPIWDIKNEMKNKIFIVENIIKIDTNKLEINPSDGSFSVVPFHY